MPTMVVKLKEPYVHLDANTTYNGVDFKIEDRKVLFETFFFLSDTR